METNNQTSAAKSIAVVKELNIARKNMQIYPPEHDQATQSLDRAYNAISNLLADREEWRLGVAKTTLLTPEEIPELSKLAASKELAVSLSGHDIAALTFSPGVEKTELQTLLSLVGSDPDDADEELSIKKIIASGALSGIDIKLINYDQLNYTEEAEIEKHRDQQDPGSDKTEWQTFVKHFLNGTLSRDDSGITVDDHQPLNPDGLANLINTNKITIEDAVNSYGQMIDIQTESAVPDEQKKAGVSRAFKGLSTMLQHLNPDLRQQFLSATVDRLAPSHSASPNSDSQNVALPFIVDIIKQANMEERGISPSLLNLMKKLDGSGAEVPSTPEALAPPGISTAHPHTELATREKYEDYVPDDYNALLSDFSSTSRPETQTAEFPLDEHLKTIEDAALDNKIGRLLLLFINADTDESEYRIYAERLYSITEELVSEEQFHLPAEIYHTLEQHAEYKRTPGIRAIASDTCKKMREPAFTSKAVKGFCTNSDIDHEKYLEFIISLGPHVVTDALGAYTRLDAPSESAWSFKLLSAFPKDTLDEMRKRLRGANTDYIARLIPLVTTLGDKESVDMLRPLWEHHNYRIQVQILAALLNFHDQWGVLFLRQWLQSGDTELVPAAIRLAGQYRIKEVSADLAAMLKKIVFFKIDISKNCDIIEILGRIGDPRVLPQLNKLARNAIGIHRHDILTMKQAVFKSLSGYPKETTAELLAFGLKSSDDTIRKKCESLMASNREKTG
jgi:hypothetical protein